MDYRVEQVDAQHEVHLHSVDRRDLDIIKEHCAASRSAGLGNGKDDKLAMTCDGFTIWTWCVNKGVSWKEFWRDQKVQTRFLNDPDNAAFRVWQGRL